MPGNFKRDVRQKVLPVKDPDVCKVKYCQKLKEGLNMCRFHLDVERARRKERERERELELELELELEHERKHERKRERRREREALEERNA
jgi:hypothetical protein